MSEKDPTKPWLYPSGNRLDPSDRLATRLKQVVPDYDDNGQKMNDVIFEDMVFGLAISFESQHMENIIPEPFNLINQNDNAQSPESQHMENIISEPLNITNS